MSQNSRSIEESRKIIEALTKDYAMMETAEALEKLHVLFYKTHKRPIEQDEINEATKLAMALVARYGKHIGSCIRRVAIAMLAAESIEKGINPKEPLKDAPPTPPRETPF